MSQKAIIIKDYANVRSELIANAAITPGHLVERMSTNKVRVHATGGGSVTPIMFALENELEGQDIHDAYAALDPVQIVVARPGDEIYAILNDGQSVAIGDKLESAGAGVLQKHTADDSDDVNVASQLVGIALEAVDTSASSAAASGDSGLGFDKRIKIQIV